MENLSKNSHSNKPIVWVLLGIMIALIGILVILALNYISPRDMSQPSIIAMIPVDSIAADGTKLGTIVRLELLEPGKTANNELFIPNDCPEIQKEKEIITNNPPAKNKKEAIVKKTTSQVKKQLPKKKVVDEVKKEVVKEVVDEVKNDVVMGTFEEAKPLAGTDTFVSDTIQIEVLKTTADSTEQLFSHQAIRPLLPKTIHGLLQDKGEFHYDFNIVSPEQLAALNRQNAQNKLAKKKIITGGVLLGTAILGYTVTECVPVPSQITWNGYDPLHSANRHHDFNVEQDKNLNTLRLARAGIVVVGAVGSYYIIKGLCLLDNTTIDVTPTKFSLMYRF